MLKLSLPTRPRALHRQERGQVFWLVVALMAVIGGAIAFAVDIGSYATDRRNLQNAADAIALAASGDLPDQALAQAAANQWAVKNGIDPTSMTVTIIPQSLPSEPNPKVRVRLEREHEFSFARLIGINSATVETTATAIKTSPAGGNGVIPLSVTEEALAGITYGQEVVLKYDANNITQGNTSPLRIDGPGSGNCGINDKYCSGVMNGTDTVVCATGADSTYCDGATQVDTEPGNKVGATRTAIDYRLTSTDTQCDEFTETFEDDPTTSDAGVYRITQECNPFLSGSYTSERVIIVPIIQELCNGACTVTITGFVLAFLERIGDGGCTGNECEVVARFVRVNQNVGLLAGTFNVNSANQFVRLVN